MQSTCSCFLSFYFTLLLSHRSVTLPSFSACHLTPPDILSVNSLQLFLCLSTSSVHRGNQSTGAGAKSTAGPPPWIITVALKPFISYCTIVSFWLFLSLGAVASELGNVRRQVYIYVKQYILKGNLTNGGGPEGLTQDHCCQYIYIPPCMSLLFILRIRQLSFVN